MLTRKKRMYALNYKYRCERTYAPLIYFKKEGIKYEF